MATKTVIAADNREWQVRRNIEWSTPAMGDEFEHDVDGGRGAMVLILSSLVVNIFALAAPLFSMTVYNKVLGQKALDTLDVLVIGMGAGGDEAGSRKPPGVPFQQVEENVSPHRHPPHYRLFDFQVIQQADDVVGEQLD